MPNQQLLIQQLDNKLSHLQPLKGMGRPAAGWIHGIRNALKMTLKQLGGRLGITPQSVKEIELRENKGAITLETMEKVGRAMDMKFVYGFLPNSGSLERTIDNRARELATKIVQRASMSMKLENQEVSAQRVAQEINELAEEIKRAMPKSLWG
jgi:predicted DNA-binding mobile mystery protein A